MRASLTVTAYLLIGIAPVAADECRPNHVEFDVCAFAREVQTKTAPSLPIKISANVTFINILAVGPLLSIGVQWNFTATQIDVLISASQKTPEQFYAAMDEYNKNSICGSPDTAAFVRLGGSAQYIYMTTDGKTVRTIRISNCPAAQK
jgi:hypothetical protein